MKVPWFVRNFRKNWDDSDEPVVTKLGQVARNRFVATGLMRGCCGHHGEPGC